MTRPQPPFGSIDCFSAIPISQMAPYEFERGSNSGGGRSTSRSWEAAETTRLNESHWAGASTDVLQSLSTDLPELQRRTRHESINNSLIDGAIETEQTNVVSSRGPSLQILTADNNFNAAAEALFAAWSVSCEFQDDLSLTDLIEGWVAQWKIYGEILIQEIVGRSVAQYKLHDLGAEALDFNVHGKNIFSGVECDDAGRVIRYHICDPGTQTDKQRLPKEFALHLYRRRFAQQRRGFPGLASALEPTADLRDYDNSVSDAARAAADSAVFFVSNHPDAEFKEPDQKVLPIRRRVRQYIRPGWDVKSLAATQPATTYASYRKEKHTDIGGALEMPWMILRRDASNHNMSSARFDGSRYARSVERLQVRIERRALTPIVRRLIRIAQMEGVLPMTPPLKNPALENLRFDFPEVALPISWTWPKPPPVDALKDAMSERIRIENGTLALSEAISAAGGRPDETIRLRSRDNADLIAANLPPIMGAIPSEIEPDVLAAIITGEEPPTPTDATDPEIADAEFETNDDDDPAAAETTDSAATSTEA